MEQSRFQLNGDNTPWVSVSLERTRPCNLHAGIVYRDSGLSLRRLHFGWHERLYDHPYSTVPCAAPELDDADAMWMATFCGKIARNASNKTIPYNLKYDEDVEFDDATGAIKFGDDSTGLGCGTFVLAVFRSGRNRLVDMTAWPPADHEDRAVQFGFVNQLLDSPNPSAQQQGRRINSEIGTKRVRPDHVAGACLEDQDDRPAKYPQCEPNARLVIATLDGTAP